MVKPKGRFWRISTAGVFFEGGAAAADTTTVVASLVGGLTGSAFGVGAAAAIVRYGWLFPQLFVAFFAQRRRQRMPFYMLGAFGRVVCLAGVAALLMAAGTLPAGVVVAAFFVLWTVYAFVSGIVAVPYNDIVGRSIASGARSRMLAVRFFGGGLLALAVAAVAHRVLGGVAFPGGHAAILLLGAGLLLVSTLSFVSAGETAAPPAPANPESFLAFVREGFDIFAADTRFRLFVYARWLDGAVTMSLPFYILQATTPETYQTVGLLLAAQTAGALLSNPLWGWWGDRRGKRSLLEFVVMLGVAAPSLTLVWLAAGARPDVALAWFAVVFLLLGAVGNGSTIAMLGYLMEISPDDRRPAYSGYFNALVAPVALSPVLGAAIVETVAPAAVFAASAAAAIIQFIFVRRLRRLEPETVNQ